jgi:hypothetical protein
MAYKIFLDKEFDAPSDKVIFDQLVDRFKVAFKKEIKSEFHFLFTVTINSLYCSCTLLSFFCFIVYFVNYYF